MENKQNFIDRTNYDQIFIRNVIVGLLGFFRGKIKWYNKSQELGQVSIHVPFYCPLLGDTRYVMDAFYDDIVGDRINGNTDQIPRGIIKLDSWQVKMDEFANPNIEINATKELDDELIEIVSKVKSIPVKLVFSLDIVVDNEIDIYKAWQSLMKTLFMYKYFVFDYASLPIQANFNFIGDTTSPMTRESKFGDVRQLLLNYPIEVHTHLPVFDYEKWDIVQYEQGIYNIGDLVYCNGKIFRSKINNNKSNPCENDQGWELHIIHGILHNKMVNFISPIYDETDKFEAGEPKPEI